MILLNTISDNHVTTVGPEAASYTAGCTGAHRGPASSPKALEGPPPTTCKRNALCVRPGGTAWMAP